jgi:hypothetical protein
MSSGTSVAGMRLRRPHEVPITAAVSGVVFVLAMVNFDGTNMNRNELLLFTAWGLLYVIESLVRKPRPRVSETQPADPHREPRPGDRIPGATDGARR